MSNQLLKHARVAKKDEFYTQYDTIEKEMKYHFDAFRNKTIMCNCDDPVKSNFSKYFLKNFNQLHLKRLIVTGMALEPTQRGMLLDISRVPKQLSPGFFQRNVKQLVGNGDYASQEVINYMKQVDIVVTNPPFSLFRLYFDQLMHYKKKFLVITNLNTLKYRNVVPFIIENQVWLGDSIHSGGTWMEIPANYPANAQQVKVTGDGHKLVNISGIRWLTNLKSNAKASFLELTQNYSQSKYPYLDGTHVIEVSKTRDIPKDYNELMAVPISFLDKYNPRQFVIIGIAGSGSSRNKYDLFKPKLNGKLKFVRFIIRKVLN